MTLEDMIREAREEGWRLGYREGLLEALVEQMLKDGRTPKEINDFCHIPMKIIERVRDGLEQNS